MIKTVKDQERTIIEVLIRQALEKLFINDRFLLEIDANERSITHKLAEYLQDIFENWNVDCEYNRYYQDSKRLQKILLFHNNEKVEIDDIAAKSVFPDIIIHGRGTEFNLIVIEVKKSTSLISNDFDLLKLREYKKQLHYKYALSLILSCGSDLSKGEIKYNTQWV